MKKVVSAFILVLTLACFSVVGVYAAVVEKPVIEAEMPDCYMEIGSGSIVLYANATVPDGGTVRYQWYVADTENMAMIHAIFGAESDIYQVPEEIETAVRDYATEKMRAAIKTYDKQERLDYRDVAVLAAMNITEEYFKLQQEYQELLSIVDEEK